MQDYPQGPAVGQSPATQPAGQQHGRYDPRRVADMAQVERLRRAQALARAKAQETSTIFLATVVSLATSAFGVVAALAWNQAIEDNLQSLINGNSLFKHLSKNQGEIIYAVIVTLVAVSVIILINRLAARIAKKAAIDAASADAGNV